MKTIKISKYLSEAGIASRRKAESMVEQGCVSVNGKKMTNVASRIDPARDLIEVGGKIVKLPALAYYLLNKPAGYTSTTEDKHAEKLITELVPNTPKVWPVGRLDKYTSGLIILSNDGDFTQRLTHPRYMVQKEYEITANTPLSEAEVSSIQRGLKLEDGFMKPDKFTKTGDRSYRIIIHSGKKHIVRRIIEKTGHMVVRLERIRIGSLTLDGLPSGIWRNLTEAEVLSLAGKKLRAVKITEATR